MQVVRLEVFSDEELCSDLLGCDTMY